MDSPLHDLLATAKTGLTEQELAVAFHTHIGTELWEQLDEAMRMAINHFARRHANHALQLLPQNTIESGQSLLPFVRDRMLDGYALAMRVFAVADVVPLYSDNSAHAQLNAKLLIAEFSRIDLANLMRGAGTGVREAFTHWSEHALESGALAECLDPAAARRAIQAQLSAGFALAAVERALFEAVEEGEAHAESALDDPSSPDPEPVQAMDLRDFPRYTFERYAEFRARRAQDKDLDAFLSDLQREVGERFGIELPPVTDDVLEYLMGEPGASARMAVSTASADDTALDESPVPASEQASLSAEFPAVADIVAEVAGGKLKIRCPGCSKAYAVPVEARGKKSKCRNCGVSFQVGASDSASNTSTRRSNKTDLYDATTWSSPSLNPIRMRDQIYARCSHWQCGHIFEAPFDSLAGLRACPKCRAGEEWIQCRLFPNTDIEVGLPLARKAGRIAKQHLELVERIEHIAPTPNPPKKSVAEWYATILKYIEKNGSYPLSVGEGKASQAEIEAALFYMLALEFVKAYPNEEGEWYYEMTDAGRAFLKNREE